MKRYLFIGLFVFLACEKGKDHPTALQVYIPNAFTPNYDGINDEFAVVVYPLIELSGYEITIYDKNLFQVFHSTNHWMNWNGKQNNTGLKMEIGIYTYIIRYTDKNQITETRTGTLLLYR